LAYIFPTTAEIEEVVRFTTNARVRTGGTINLSSLVATSNYYANAANDVNLQAVRVMSSMERAEEGQRVGDQVVGILKRWSVNGLIDISSGAISWRNAWASLQCSSIWSYKPLDSLVLDGRLFKELISLRGEHKGLHTRYSEWSVDCAEGPERVRKLLEQYLLLPTEQLNEEIERYSKQVKTISVTPTSMKPASSQKMHPSAKSSFSYSMTDPSSVTPTGKGVQKAVAEENPLESDTSPADSMEHFLRRLSLKGLIKRMDIFSSALIEPLRDDDLVALPDSSQALDDMEVEETDGAVETPKESSDSKPFNEEFSFVDESQSLQPYLLDDEESFDLGSRAMKLSCKAFSTDSEDLLNSDGLLRGGASSVPSTLPEKGEYPSEKMKQNKSLMLREIVKGIIGSSEYAQGKFYSVKR
jgi:hypothetical protein